MISVPMGVYNRGRDQCDICEFDSTVVGVAVHRKRSHSDAKPRIRKLQRCGFCAGIYVCVEEHISTDCICTNFEQFIEYGVVKVDEKECWIWRGDASNPGGSGKLGGARASKRSYEVFHGVRVVDGYVVCHTCDVSECVNPQHLFVGTQSDNIRDMHLKGRAPDRRGDSHWTRKTLEGRTKAKSLMSGSDSPMRRPDVLAKVSGENHWSRRDPEKFAEHQQKMSAAAAEKQRSRSSQS